MICLKHKIESCNTCYFNCGIFEVNETRIFPIETRENIKNITAYFDSFI